MSDSTRQLLMTTELFAPGGIQYVSRQALAALRQRGPLAVWTLNDAAVPAAQRTPGVTISCAAGSRWRLASWALSRAAQSCRGLGIVAMHTHLAPVALPLRMRGAHLTVMLHGVEVWRRLTAAERTALLHADRLIANSRHTIDRFRSENPVFADVPIDVCALGVEPAAPAAAERTDENAALMVSRLSAEDRYKGHDAVLRAWVDVRRVVPAARLVLVGDGDDRPRLEALAASLGIGPAVTFVGRTSDDELQRWYERCAFFVLPSTGEGFGLVYLEAMRAGKACLACAGAATEVVDADVTGLVVPRQDAGPLAAAIVRLFSDEALRTRLGRNGRQRWADGFTSDRFAERFRLLTDPLSSRAA